MHRVNAAVVCGGDKVGDESEGLKVRWHISRKHEASGGISMDMSGTRAFHAEGRIRAKALRPENAWCVQDTTRRSV